MSGAGGTATMRWASAHSALEDGSAAAAEAAAALRDALGEGPVDLALIFFRAPHVESAAAMAGVLRSALSPACLLGSSTHGVISSEHEIEGGAALTVIAARLPGVELSPFVMMNEMWNDAVTEAHAFAQAAPGAKDAELVLVMADPFDFGIERTLEAFNRHAPGVRVVGGMASGVNKPRGNALVLNDWLAHEGGVAVALKGALRVDVIVSQGCLPIGPPLEVTRSQQNLVIELDGQPALERAEQVLQSLGPVERERLRNGLYMGRPVRGGDEGRGSYLIRNLLGADRDRGVIAIGDLVREREKLRLHVRDAASAREDLELLLAPQEFDSRAAGALLFACNGRGRGLFGEPDGDIRVLQSALGGAVPVAGMFCAGEIGPVGGRNYLHGHTASIAVVRAGPSG